MPRCILALHRSRWRWVEEFLVGLGRIEAARETVEISNEFHTISDAPSSSAGAIFRQQISLAAARRSKFVWIGGNGSNSAEISL